MSESEYERQVKRAREIATEPDHRSHFDVCSAARMLLQEVIRLEQREGELMERLRKKSEGWNAVDP